MTSIRTASEVVEGRGGRKPHMGRFAPVFIYSGYRASSTWLWSKFRRNPTAWAYYEPFNESLASLKSASILSVRPDTWKSHHPSGAAYMAEYGPLLGSEPGVPLFPSGDQNGERFIGAAGIEGPVDADVEAYVSALISAAQMRDRVPVLSCTRMLGRAAGFRAAFGGQHILLIRNLFQQWNSYSGQSRIGQDYFLWTLFQSLNAAPKNNFLMHLKEYFPEEDIDDFSKWSKIENHDKIFCYFSAFYTYLLMITRRHSDIVIDANRLARSGTDLQQQIASLVASKTGLEIDLSDARESIDYPLQPLQSLEDCRILLKAMVDRILVSEARSDEERQFVEGLIADMWDEHSRFTVATAGAAEVIADQTARVEIETSSRREAEAAQAGISEELAAARNQLAHEAKAHAAEMVEVRIAATEELSRRDAAAQQEQQRLAREVGRLEGHLAAQIEAHAAQLAEAARERRDLTVRVDEAECALSASRDRFTTLEAELIAQTRAHEAAMAALTTERGDLHAQAQGLQTEIGQLRVKITLLKQRLQEATDLLGAIPDPLTGLSRLRTTVVRLMTGKARLESISQHRLAAARWRSDSEVSAEIAIVRPENLSLASNFKVANAAFIDGDFSMNESNGPIRTVPRLLAAHDRLFIHIAFHALLGRAPDDEGEAYYLTRLRNGVHKLTILKQLRRSPEGRAFVPGVAGLDRAIKRHSLANLPFVGVMIAWLIREERDTQTTIALRRMEHRLALQIAQARSPMSPELKGALDWIDSRIGRLLEISEGLGGTSKPSPSGELRVNPTRAHTIKATTITNLHENSHNLTVSDVLAQVELQLESQE